MGLPEKKSNAEITIFSPLFLKNTKCDDETRSKGGQKIFI
jgi:hypothetical protein